MKELTKAEELLLLTIWRLKDNAYGVAIKREIDEKTGKALKYGTLYFILDQLANKELVFREKGEPTPERGGKSKIYYRLTETGFKALEESLEMQKKVWEGFKGLSYGDLTGK
ncbi:PadR family transcriptional regulator [candidate division KSB1 bacterium]